MNGVTFNGKTHTAVALKDAEGKSLTVGGKQVYALFTGWSITGRADKSYLFKKINTETALLGRQSRRRLARAYRLQ